MDAEEKSQDTVADLIAFLQALPPETKVEVLTTWVGMSEEIARFVPLSLHSNAICTECEDGSFRVRLGDN